MRFIDLAFVQPPHDFSAKVAAAEADGEDNIANHSSVWRDCKATLKAASSNKCYYCEIKECRSDGDVDHYRPKSKYKWAAFRFDNFRFACYVFATDEELILQPVKLAVRGLAFHCLKGANVHLALKKLAKRFPFYWIHAMLLIQGQSTFLLMEPLSRGVGKRMIFKEKEQSYRLRRITCIIRS